MKHKSNKRTLNFFRLSYGFRRCYQIVVDGTFLFRAAKLRLDIRRQLQRLLLVDDKTEGLRLFVTPCIIAELERLGEPLVDALRLAQQMPRIRCNHSVCVSATKCICSIVGKSNEKHHVFVATIDDALRTACRKVAGTPIITFSQQSLLLERPSDVSRAHATLGEEKKRAPTGKETHALNVERGLARRTAERPVERGAEAFCQLGRRKRKAHAPNPLSVKKRKNNRR